VVVMRRLVAGQLWVRLLVALISISLIASAALALRGSQRAASAGVTSRFASRAALAAKFVGTYVTELAAREQLVASNTLAGPSDLEAPFAADIAAFGFEDGVLLDSAGRALAISPAAPALIGQQYAAQFAPLAAALKGHLVVTDVITAPNIPPLVGFAVPFDTPSGRRVFSGAYQISDTPLAALLGDTTTLQNAQLYLIDDANTVFATNVAQPPSAQTLIQRDQQLGAAVAKAGVAKAGVAKAGVAKAAAGSYKSGSTPYTFVKTAIPGTPWSYVIAAPTSGVFVSINGSSHWLPWLILGGLSLLILVAAWLTIRLLAGRRRLADLNAKLIAIARTDPLTGLSNRLHLTETLYELLANAYRRGYPVCVLMIDIDHFKHLNDTYGHRAGDQALRHVAQRLSTSLREGDLLARWGGEEFLAVLPHTDLEQGMAVAERVCHLLADVPIEIGENNTLVAIQTSVGVAEFAGDTLDALVDRADLGLYEAKAAGRNTVRATA
jgi:diguanylate cyclase (GGDEF)-like protein